MRSSLSAVRNRIVLAIAALLTTVAGAAFGQTPEFRAMWVSRFEWPNANEATCKAKIDTVMQTLAAHHFNAVFFQVRGQCDVLYPSPEEVWSPLIGGTDPGWDPLAYAIAAAHANGLEFHAYINTHTCWLGDVLPANPNHLFYAHCNAADPDHRDWLICDPYGTPVQYGENYVWIAPGIPDFQAYWRRQVMHVVRNYDVDGVHFDRIRTPGPSFSHDPVSRVRLASPQSNPEALGFAGWTADQTTRLVRDIYAEIMAIKPQVKVSAAVFSNDNSAASVYQDAPAWAQTGGMDMLVPMMYFSGGMGSTWDINLQNWLSGSSGRHVIAGHYTPEGTAELLGQVALTRTRGAQGNSIFSYDSFTGWSAYLANVYQQPVATPAMHWKDTPFTGTIYGYVKDADGRPVVDAQVTRSGSRYNGLSSADGLYSLLLVPPGTHTITASHAGYGPATATADAVVTAGQVTRRDITLGSAVPPLIAPVTPAPDSATRGREYMRQLVLSQGVASSWTLLQGPAGARLDAATGFVRWVPMPVDAGRLVTFEVRASGPAGADQEAWDVQVQMPPECATFNLTGFEGYANGTRMVFRDPRYSSVSSNLALTPNTAEVTDEVPAFDGGACYKLQWQYLDASPQRWARITTHNMTIIPSPTVALDRPIRLRLRLDSGRLRLSLGIRETGTTADLGQSGGTTGSIEFLGAATKFSGAPQGVLVEPMPGVWQTLIFDPRNHPLVSYTGDGVLYSATGKGTLECLAFSIVDGVGPFTVYIDDIDFLCDTPGDFDYDGDADQSDFGHFQACFGAVNLSPASLTGCRSADFDLDTDVDSTDFTGWEPCLNGPARPPACR